MGFKIKRILFVLILLFNITCLFAQIEQNTPNPPPPPPPNSQEPAPEVPPVASLEEQQPQSVNEPDRTMSSSVEISSPNEAPSEANDKGVKFNKEKISLDLKGVDVIELFRILSQKMGLTIVPTKNVSGRLNIFLNNLSFNDVLDVVLISQDLASDRKGDIINIMTSAEYERLYGKKYNEKRKFANVKLNYAKPSTVFNVLGQIKSDVGRVVVDEGTGNILLIDIPEKLKFMEDTISSLDRPPETQIFDIKYAKPADIKTQLSSVITSGTGELYVDERSGKVMVSDLPGKMKKIKKMFKAIDEPSTQVFIEAEILQITLRKEYQRGGINWERVFQGSDGFDLKGVFPIAASFSPNPALSAAANLLMTVGTVSQDRYHFTMQLLETFGETKVLSRPRITAISGQEAKVMVGSREAYVSQTQSQSDVTTITSENIQFIDVGVKLNVVPIINADGFITMKIKPEVSSVRETLTTALKSTVPIVETAEAETTVKVKDGTMIMIAGLMKDEKHKGTTGVPWLAKIPILGAFFGSRATQNKRTEIIIFLTPHLVTGDVSISDKEKERIFSSKTIPSEMQSDIAELNAASAERRQKKSPAKTSAEALNKEAMQEKVLAGEEKAKNVDIQEKMKGIKK